MSNMLVETVADELPDSRYLRDTPADGTLYQ
jgi:hypothetical protein